MLKRSICQFYKTCHEAISDIPSGSSIAVGGFGTSGVPENLLKALSEKPVSNLKFMSIDCTIDNYGVDWVLKNKQISHLTVSFVGDSKNFQKQFFDGTLSVDFTPMGTLVEKFRTGGAGIPAFYTKTGTKTPYVEGLPKRYKPGGLEVAEYSLPKDTKIFNNREYILEPSLNADFAFIKAWKGDKLGNLVFKGNSQNSNPDVAKCAKISIAEVEELVEPGEIDPKHVHLPGVYVDRIVNPSIYIKPILHLKYKSDFEVSAAENVILTRAAKEINPGMTVNLGVGLPQFLQKYLQDKTIILQSENGLLGVGDYPEPGQEDPDLINPGKETITMNPGAALFDSSESFAMIRGSHIDVSVLGALQISLNCEIASWMVPGKLIRGMGGAMDLVGSDSRKIVTMIHSFKDDSKIVEKCSYPLTGSNISMLITELGVFENREGKLTLIELMPGVSLELIQAKTKCRFETCSSLKGVGQA